MTTRAPHIVLIDDDRAWLKTLADFFEGKGYRVRTAQGGRAGLSLLEHDGARLAIVDFQMPEMNGLELLRRLRRSRRDLAVLMLSSEDDPSLPPRVLAEGARAFLSKTMAPVALLRALLQVVGTLDLPVAEALGWERLLPVPRRRALYLPVPLSFFEPQEN
jgi:DNA-binding response OmpR family regulator